MTDNPLREAIARIVLSDGYGPLDRELVAEAKADAIIALFGEPHPTDPVLQAALQACDEAIRINAQGCLIDTDKLRVVVRAARSGRTL